MEISITQKLVEKLKDDSECLEFLGSLIVKINQLSYENKNLRKRNEKLLKSKGQRRVTFRV